MSGALIALAMLAALAPAGAGQPAPVPSASAAIDPDRLVAARALMDLTLPPDRRDAMIEQMIAPMMANIRDGLRQAPQFAELQRRDPSLGDALERFMARQQARSFALLRTMMPDMIEAMAKAYARRFTIAQLDEVSTFYQTPTGRIMREQMPTIMSDPDVASWQRAMMTRSMETLQADVAEFIAEADAAKR